jgi:hypothetical protein
MGNCRQGTVKVRTIMEVPIVSVILELASGEFAEVP